MVVQQEGIVVRSMDYGEGHKIITLYTREAGKQSVMARGAKKLKSRHAAVTQLFTHGMFVYYKSGQMGTLNHAEILQAHHPLREDLHKSAYASYIAELIWRMTDEQEGSEFLFEQLQAALEVIEEGKHPAVVMHIMELRLLASAGYAPELFSCVNCGRGEDLRFFSPMAGGVLCASCAAGQPGAKPAAEAVLRLLRIFQRLDVRRLGNVDIKPETARALKEMLNGYMDAHLEMVPKSRRFLEQMEKYGL